MVTVRFPRQLEEQIKTAAARQGETESEFIREASAQRAATVLSSDARARLSSMIGAVCSESGSGARDTGRAFADVLVEKRQR